jgi:hypothetical protein
LLPVQSSWRARPRRRACLPGSGRGSAAIPSPSPALYRDDIRSRIWERWSKKSLGWLDDRDRYNSSIFSAGSAGYSATIHKKTYIRDTPWYTSLALKHVPS